MTKNATPQQLQVTRSAPGQPWNSRPQALSGGNAALGWTLTGIEQGDTLTIDTDGSNDFGQYGPIRFARINMIGKNEGDTISLDEGRGIMSANNAGLPLVADVPELPYGKALVLGTDDSAINSVNYRQANVVEAGGLRHREIFEALYLFWPEQNQANAASLLDGGATWQIKPLWEFDTENGFTAGSTTDYFIGLPTWYNPGEYWTQGYKVISNDQPISTFDRTSTNGRDPSDIKKMRANPMYRQVWTKPGDTPGSTAGSDGMYRITDSVDGLLEEKSWLNIGQFSSGTAASPGTDRFSMPGFVRGFNSPLGCEFYISDIYKTVGNGPKGEGAAARIEFTDTEDYAQAKVFSVVSVTSWAAGRVIADIHKGMHSTLTGTHMQLFNSLNQRTYIGRV